MKLYTNKQIEEIKSKAAADAISTYKKELQNEYTAIESAIKARAECPASFDFNDENINVFSVERMEMPSIAGVPNISERTVIGYFIFDENGGTIIKEWNLYCSREDHNKLVEEFRAIKKNIKQEKPASKKSLIKG
jgi:hypothetical protein